MRAVAPLADKHVIARHLAYADSVDGVTALGGGFAAVDAELIDTVLDTASRFAQDILVPLNHTMDRDGVRLVDGRIITTPGHKDAWERFVAGGWTTLEHPQAYGGQGLPLALALAAQEIVDRACPAFGMLVVLQRAASRLIAAWGDDAIRQEWLPGLMNGEIGATICISEPGAGSDVAQLSTRARLDEHGVWRIDGNKCWISFGDHDLTHRIVHCLLARTGTDQSGRPEIGLFLVDCDNTQGDAIQIIRKEEKLGLHGSPTCAIAFQNAKATLLGDPARGLSQMFAMISHMRLAVGAMGLGIASAAADTAIAYALERKQGGKPGQPVPIASHVDVQLQLTEMITRTELLRGLIYACANHADIAENSENDQQRAASVDLLQFLLPIVKTMGANASFLNASSAIQVLGGAGYTRDWPVEQALRDARILAVFEGTTGIQALDMVHRRVRGRGTGLAQFLANARALDDNDLNDCLDRLESAVRWIRDETVSTANIEAGAVAFLDLATLAASGWIAARIRRMGDEAPLRMRLASRHCLEGIAKRSAALEDQVRADASTLASHEDLKALVTG